MPPRCWSPSAPPCRALCRVPRSGWSVTDPGIILPTWPIHLVNVDFNQGVGYWEREFSVEDRLLFRDLAARERPVGTLHAETAGLLARSSRYREAISSLGFGDELRAVMRASGTAWGLIELVRGKDENPFSDAEVDFVAELLEPLATLLRARVMNAPSGDSPVPATPGVLVFTADSALKSSNDAATSWLREMPNVPDGPESLPSPVRAVLAYSHAVARGFQRGPARLRVRLRSGQWAVVDASTLRAAEPCCGHDRRRDRGRHVRRDGIDHRVGLRPFPSGAGGESAACSRRIHLRDRRRAEPVRLHGARPHQVPLREGGRGQSRRTCRPAVHRAIPCRPRGGRCQPSTGWLLWMMPSGSCSFRTTSRRSIACWS